MNIQPLIIFVLIGSLLMFPGCKAGAGGRKKFTDWSIPTVKLASHSKDDKVTPPAEKAKAESTANLAHDRLKGHNPTAAIRANDDDPTLRPDPQEIAKLNDFEGRQIPDWATGSLPPAPEASAPIPSERIAQNVNEQAMAAESTTPDLPVTPEQNLNQNQSMELGSTLPDSIELPDSIDSLPNSVDSLPSADSLPGPGASVANLPSELPAPDANTLPAPQAGDPMMELPGTNSGNVVQASAEVPAQGAAPAKAQTQPPVLFMPGNINPQYPNTPSSPQQSAPPQPAPANPYFAP